MKSKLKRSKLPVGVPPLQAEGLIKILYFGRGSQVLEEIDIEICRGSSVSFLEGAG
jgi:hypothetical protein